MKLSFLEIILTVGYVALAVFLVLIIFIKPDFMQPVTTWVHELAYIQIGGARISLGDTAALILFFGFIVPSAYWYTTQQGKNSAG